MAWIAALIGAAGSGVASKQAKDAQSDASKDATAQLNLASLQARKGLGPYSKIGKQAQYDLANLMGISGYGSAEEIQLTNLKKPTLAQFMPGAPKDDKIRSLIKGHPGGQLGVDVGAAVAGLPGAGQLASRKGKKADKKARERYATELAIAKQRHKQALKKYEKKKADLEGIVAGQRERGELKTGGERLLDSEAVKFRTAEAAKLQDASGSARGDQLSGQAKLRLEEMGQGIASQEFGNEFNRLAALAEGGQQAATYQGNVATGTGSNLANLSLTGGRNEADYYGNLNQALQGTLSNVAYLNKRDNTSTISPTNYSTNVVTDDAAREAARAAGRF